MNRRSFFRNIGLVVAAVTTGLHFSKPKLKEVWYAPAGVVQGYKGTEYLKAGFIYAPYIPLYCTTQVVGNVEFAKRFDKYLRSATIMT